MAVASGRPRPPARRAALIILRDLAAQTQAVGPLMMDAVLAALAIEHSATLMTTDRDSARFVDLRQQNPLTS